MALIDPCFDNIRDILRHEDVAVESLKEEWLHHPACLYENLKAQVSADAIFIVDPNNPTGFTLTGPVTSVAETKRGFLELFRYAKDYNKLLIFDFCFASFMLPSTELGIFDIYQDLEESGVSYIAIEDTGKTWPLQDAKVAMLKTSRDLRDEIYPIYTSYLLNVSPFVLSIVREYVEDSEQDNFASVRNLLKRNRVIAKDVLAGSILQFQEPKSPVSVAWFKITDSRISATELQKAIRKAGTYVLPGTYFFWSDPQKGEQYIRIALARDTDMFEPAIRRFRAAADQFAQAL